jgi:hypothetical protein
MRAEGFNPLYPILIDEDTRIVLDGWHRNQAAMRANVSPICIVRKYNGPVERLSAAVTANLQTGLNQRDQSRLRTVCDLAGITVNDLVQGRKPGHAGTRERIRQELLKDHTWSNRVIAGRIGCGDPIVALVRADLVAGAIISHLDQLRGADGKWYPAGDTAPPPESNVKHQGLWDALWRGYVEHGKDWSVPSTQLSKNFGFAAGTVDNYRLRVRNAYMDWQLEGRGERVAVPVEEDQQPPATQDEEAFAAQDDPAQEPPPYPTSKSRPAKAPPPQPHPSRKPAEPVDEDLPTATETARAHMCQCNNCGDEHVAVDPPSPNRSQIGGLEGIFASHSGGGGGI